MNDIDEHLQQAARTPLLLVASDYDGTVAPITDDPTQAKPLREAVVALRILATLPQTHVALISGRALRDLVQLIGAPDDVHLVGSHGSEFDLGFTDSLPEDAVRLRQRVEDELRQIASQADGFTIEPKPAGVAFHYRNAPEHEANRALDRVLAGPAALEGVYTKHGKKVVELSVVTTNKGQALETIRHRVGASAVVYLGDDKTDEDAFKTLTGPDLAIKVGPGDSIAPNHIDGPRDVARLLARLAELRIDWLAGAHAVPIEHHAMLSDQRTAALITPNARIVWFCAPRIDSPALFAELLGGPSAGHFTVQPADGREPVAQRYLDHCLVLETRWPDFTVTDFLDCSAGRPNQRAGRSDLVRIVEGSGKITVEFAPRLDFGRMPTRLIAREGGLEVEGALDPIVLRSPGVRWTIDDQGPHQAARADVELTPGQPLTLDLCCGSGSLHEPASKPNARLEHTQRFWSNWAQQLTLPTVATDFVRHSALILKALCYGPTGAVIAAGTTSLPEHVGGVRNWDYRYCWLRDAAMAASALISLGSTAEAMQFLDWVLGVLDYCRCPERLAPLYTVTGHELGPEADITELPGYRGSRPVRVGNSASRQVQLDVFGPVVELIAQLTEHDAPLSANHWRLVQAMVHAVEQRWHEPDHGIWEIRRPRRHHVHSKVMCWLTVDRAVAIAARFLHQDRQDWKSLRQQIADDVLTHGYKSDGVHAFTAAYDDNDLDAAALYVGLAGLLPPDDPRFVNTVNAIEQSLLEGPTVYRYRSDDGLPGYEGGFHICASWLVDAYVLLGRHDDARSLFYQIVALAGPTGLLSEQYGPNSRRALGNIPQAYSHIGLINNAVRLATLDQPRPPHPTSPTPARNEPRP